MAALPRIKTVVDNTLAFLSARRRAYNLLFHNTQPAVIVLKDLLEFSHWMTGPARPTNEETWRLIGRQDVIRRIQQHSHLSEQQLFNLFNGGALMETGQDEDTT